MRLSLFLIFLDLFFWQIEHLGKFRSQFWGNSITCVLKGFAKIVTLGPASADMANRAVIFEFLSSVWLDVVFIHKGGFCGNNLRP